MVPVYAFQNYGGLEAGSFDWYFATERQGKHRLEDSPGNLESVLDYFEECFPNLEK